MEMEPRNLAVIGLGKMGVMHCAMISVAPGARLAAVADRRKGVRGYLEGLGIEAPFFNSLEALFARKDLHLHGAVVATPQSVHRPVAEACLRAGLGVLVEKPLAHDRKDAEAMVKLAEEFPALPTGVAYMKAHYPLYRRAKQILDSGALGGGVRAEAKSLFGQVLRPQRGWIYNPQLSGGGVLVNSACHMLQLLHFFFGAAETVEATTRRIHSREVEDEASVRIRFRSGAAAEVFASWSTPGYDTEYTEITVAGENGRLRATDEAVEVELRSGAGGLGGGRSVIRRCDVEQAAFNLSPDYGGEGYYMETVDFMESLGAPQRRPWVTWGDGWEVQRTLDAAYRSAAGGRAVEVG